MARNFDNVDDQINFGSDARLDDLSAFTQCMWVRFANNSTSEQMIATKHDITPWQGKLYLYRPNFGGRQNTLGAFISMTTGPDADSRTVDSTTALNTWYVVVSTWDGTTAAPKIYLCEPGGVMAEASYFSQVTGGGGPAKTDAPASYRIGTRDYGDVFSDMDACECGLWNRVLTAGELAALGRGFAPSHFRSGLVVYTPLVGRNSPEPNLAPGGGTEGTITGTTTVDHPRVIYPQGRHVSSPSRTITSRPLATTMSALRW